MPNCFYFCFPPISTFMWFTVNENCLMLAVTLTRLRLLFSTRSTCSLFLFLFFIINLTVKLFYCLLSGWGVSPFLSCCICDFKSFIYTSLRFSEANSFETFYFVRVSIIFLDFFCFFFAFVFMFVFVEGLLLWLVFISLFRGCCADEPCRRYQTGLITSWSWFTYFILSFYLEPKRSQIQGPCKHQLLPVIETSRRWFEVFTSQETKQCNQVNTETCFLWAYQPTSTSDWGATDKILSQI